MAYAKGVLKFAGVQGDAGTTITENQDAAEKLGAKHMVHNGDVYYRISAQVWVYTGFRIEDFEA